MLYFSIFSLTDFRLLVSSCSGSLCLFFFYSYGDHPDLHVLTHSCPTRHSSDLPQVTVSVVLPSGMQFSVMGRVKSPGTFTPGRYVNVLEALSMAGGPAEFANLDNVLIIRKSGEPPRTLSVWLSPPLQLGPDQKNVAGVNFLQITTGRTVIDPRIKKKYTT